MNSGFLITEKRPGEAATSSEPKSINSHGKETDMNVQTDSTAMTPSEVRQAMMAATYADEIEKFRSFGIRDLVVTFHTLTAGNDAMMGVLNQPRCSGASEGFIEEYLEKIIDLRELVIDELRGREPTGNGIEDDDRMEAVVLYDLSFCGDSVMNVLEWVLPQERKSNQLRAMNRIDGVAAQANDAA